MAQQTFIFQNKTANGTSPPIASAKLDPVNRWRPTVYVTGVFGGASVQINMSPDGTNWFPANAALTAPGFFVLPATCNFVEAVLSGATGTTNVSASMI